MGLWTALHEACFHGHEKVVRVLVANGAHVNHSDPVHHQTALILACANNHVGIVKYLVGKCNCHLDHRDEDGKTALMVAAAYKGANDGDVIPFPRARSPARPSPRPFPPVRSPVHSPASPSACPSACPSAHPPAQ